MALDRAVAVRPCLSLLIAPCLPGSTTKLEEHQAQIYNLLPSRATPQNKNGSLLALENMCMLKTECETERTMDAEDLVDRRAQTPYRLELFSRVWSAEPSTQEKIQPELFC